MIFRETPLSGAFVIEPNLIEDERGFFARTFDQHEFEVRDLNPCIAQCNISFNKKAGTLRGMHYQVEPYEETKLVRCTMGAIYDVIIDLRTDSLTFRQWFGVELSAQNRLMLYIPKGLAHGFQTLMDDSEVFYQMGTFYQPTAGRGIRWDDEALQIKWPLPVTLMSDNDRNYARLQ
ncbi:MAG: dTDP-4-dehydrorhamnose 3,5-epimerase [Anaerolineaceae bacterium]|nr:dTDP-4-dehydrorhamnose 3,5-epimerase [Anaerolineaceae bacterium]